MTAQGLVSWDNTETETNYSNPSAEENVTGAVLRAGRGHQQSSRSLLQVMLGPKSDSTYQPMQVGPNEVCNDAIRPVLAAGFTMAPAMPEDGVSH